MALGDIAEQAQRLGEVVDDMVAVARMQSDTLVVRSVPVDLGPLVRQIAEAPHVGGRVRTSGARAFAAGDPARIRQVVRNLVDNALRHGGTDVRVEYGGQGSQVFVAVLDDGDGVPNEFADRMFLKYEQVASSESQPATLGLGLAVARRMAELMEGELRYERADGVTAFRLVLPEDGPPPQVSDQSPGARGADREPRGITVAE
jgi:signal transduction histidine kinase